MSGPKLNRGDLADKVVRAAAAHIAWRRRADDDSLSNEQWEDGVNASLDELEDAVDAFLEVHPELLRAT